MPKIEIKKDRCKGCGFCILVCPKKILVFDKTINKRGSKPFMIIDSDMCTGCAQCAIICPDLCIEIEK